MIPFRLLLFSQLFRSAWAIGTASLVFASLLEWGRMAARPADLS